MTIEELAEDPVLLARRYERLMQFIAEELAEVEEPVLVELRVTCVMGDQLDTCPVGVTEANWREARLCYGDTRMRKHIWSVLADLEARRPL